MKTTLVDGDVAAEAGTDGDGDMKVALSQGEASSSTPPSIALRRLHRPRRRSSAPAGCWSWSESSLLLPQLRLVVAKDLFLQISSEFMRNC